MRRKIRSNLYNPEAIDAYLKDLAGKNNAELAALLILALKKPFINDGHGFKALSSIPEDAPSWLIKKWDDQKVFHEFNAEHITTETRQKIYHVKDWLQSSLIQFEKNPDDPMIAWLSPAQANDQGNPKKLLKFGSLQQAHQEADKVMHKKNTRLRQTILTYDKIEDDPHAFIIDRFDDGYCIVQIHDPEGTKAEGALMHHCIGDDVYDEKIISGETIIYSLRDPGNRPHATLEVQAENNALVQCKGKGNKPPHEKYFSYLQPFIIKSRFDLEEEISHTGLIEVDGEYHSIFKLPENCTINGNCDFSNIKTPILFPENMHVGYNLSISYQTYLLNRQHDTLPEFGNFIGIHNCNKKGEYNNSVMPDGTVLPAKQFINKKGITQGICFMQNDNDNDLILPNGHTMPSNLWFNKEGTLLVEHCFAKDDKWNNFMLPNNLVVAARQEYTINGGIKSQDYCVNGDGIDITLPDGTIVPAELLYNENGSINFGRYANNKKASKENLKKLSARLQTLNEEMMRPENTVLHIFNQNKSFIHLCEINTLLPNTLQSYQAHYRHEQ